MPWWWLWGEGVAGYITNDESYIYSSVIVFEKWWGVGSPSALYRPFLTPLYVRGEQNCEL